MDNNLEEFRGELSRLTLAISEAADLPCRTPEERDAVEARYQLGTAFKKRVGNGRMAMTRPLDKWKKVLMQQEKDFIAPLMEGMEKCETLLAAYYDNQRKVNDDKLDNLYSEHEQVVKAAGEDMNALIEADVALSMGQEIVKDADRGFKRVVRLEVFEPTQVPRLYLIVDEGALKQALAEGVEIPGARLIEESVRTGR